MGDVCTEIKEPTAYLVVCLRVRGVMSEVIYTRDAFRLRKTLQREGCGVLNDFSSGELVSESELQVDKFEARAYLVPLISRTPWQVSQSSTVSRKNASKE